MPKLNEYTVMLAHKTIPTEVIYRRVPAMTAIGATATVQRWMTDHADWHHVKTTQTAWAEAKLRVD